MVNLQLMLRRTAEKTSKEDWTTEPWTNRGGSGPLNESLATSEIVFVSATAHPRDSSPTTTDPFPMESISSRSSVVFESISSQF